MLSGELDSKLRPLEIDLMVLAELIASVLDTAPEMVNDDSGRSTLEVWDSLARLNIIAAVRCPPRPSNSEQPK